MSDSSHIYIAIDLKSFYASVECVERECDPLTTNLVVADESNRENNLSCSITVTESIWNSGACEVI